MAFPNPYIPEDLPQISGHELSPFNMNFELSKDKSKTSAWSLVKNIEHRFGNGGQVGPVVFDTTTTISKDLGIQFDQEEEDAWVENLLGAAAIVKRTRFETATPPRSRPVYRKTPPINPSLRRYRASPGSSPSPPSSPLSPVSLRRLEQTFPSESCVVDR